MKKSLKTYTWQYIWFLITDATFLLKSAQYSKGWKPSKYCSRKSSTSNLKYESLTSNSKYESSTSNLQEASIGKPHVEKICFESRSV